MYLKSWDSTATVVSSSGAAAAARREWMVTWLLASVGNVKEERQERGIFL